MAGKKRKRKAGLLQESRSGGTVKRRGQVEIKEGGRGWGHMQTICQREEEGR